MDFTFLEMNPFTLVNGKPYPLDMRGELDDTAAFKNFKKYVSLLLDSSIKDAFLREKMGHASCSYFDLQVGGHRVSTAFWQSPELH